ncbi:MAG: hypothetical protein D6707_06085 [Bacteroidetes bacterium]|nr:MAG: hypothetical protein D6707_06085 [Bacteroidota bacterium]
MPDVHILILTQNQKIAKELKDIIHAENRLIHIKNTDEADLRKLSGYALIIIDSGERRFEQGPFLKKMKAALPDTHILSITGKENYEQHIVFCLNNGASDYLTYPFNPKIVQSKVNVFERLYLKAKIIQKQSQNIDELLRNILPGDAIEEIRKTGKATVRKFDLATVMFTDFVAFTKKTQHISPENLVEQLNFYFSHFDDVTDLYYVEKIKTIGDAYMAVGGVPVRNKINPLLVCACAQAILHFMLELKKQKPDTWDIRIGIDTGSVIAGVVGKKKWQYDIWGDTVNTASRIEGACEPMKINITHNTWKHIKEYFECTYRGEIKVKHKGELKMYYLQGFKEEFANEKSNLLPNEAFWKFVSQY